LGWLRREGLDIAIAAHLSADKPTLAICGGLQMLGSELKDPHGVEAEARGLGLLPYSTEFGAAKTYRHAKYALGALNGFWAPLSGLAYDGYEIRHGITEPTARARGEAPLGAALAHNCGWHRGQTLALYPHGLFENAPAIKALFGQRTRTLDDTLDGLADFIDDRFAPGVLMSLAADIHR
jgi:adenosylcobyric acid synthase